MEESWRHMGKDKEGSVPGSARRAPGEEEGGDKDFYAFLNVPPDCSADDIKAAYKRLALIWHPDRHKDQDAREHATQKFARLTYIHEILTDPGKRQLYDLYGEKGLSSGMEVGSHLKTPEEMRDEYTRHTAKKAVRELERKLGLTGVLQTTYTLERPLQKYLQPDIVQAPLPHKRKQRRPRGSPLQAMMLSERFRTSIGRKDNVELLGFMKSEAGEASCAVSLALERRFSARSRIKAICEMGLGMLPRPLSLSTSRLLTANATGKMSLRFSEAYNELRCSVSRTLTASTLGKIQYIIGGPQTGVKLRGVRTGQDSLVAGTFWAGFGTFQVMCTAQKRLSRKTTVMANCQLGERGLDLILGVNRRISERSAFSCACVVSTMRGVMLKVGLSRLGQELSMPLVLSKELSYRSVAAGTVVPAVAGALFKVLWQKPRKEARRRRKVERERAANAEQISRARREARTDVELMRYAVARKRQMEESRGGLIVVKGIFGCIPPVSRRRAAAEAAGGDDWPTEGESTIDVSTPLQYLLEDSKLQLFNSAKSGLPGFCDPAPGEEKQLYVLYRFKGRLHEVLIGDRQPLILPLERDLLAGGAVRVVGGVAVKHEEAPRARPAV